MKLHIKTRHPNIRKEEIDSIIATNQEYLEQMAKLSKQMLATVKPKKEPKLQKEPKSKKEPIPKNLPIPSQGVLDGHPGTLTAPTFTCPACDYTSDRPYRVAQHIMKHHENKFPYR